MKNFKVEIEATQYLEAKIKADTYDKAWDIAITMKSYDWKKYPLLLGY